MILMSPIDGIRQTTPVTTTYDPAVAPRDVETRAARQAAARRKPFRAATGAQSEATNLPPGQRNRGHLTGAWSVM